VVCRAVHQSALKIPHRIGPKRWPSSGIALAFTVAPHLQIINYRGCFSPFAGI
jgi:hypothetical protein